MSDVIAGEVKNVVEKVASGLTGVMHGPGNEVGEYLHGASSGAFKGKKGGVRGGEFWQQVKGNTESAVEKGGFSSAWSMAGHHAIRGAVGGAAIGGTLSALNGGDFWDGAKSGAFKGASIYTGLRMGAAATGAENWMNPFAGKGQGMLSSAKAMWNVTGGKDVKVSRAAAKILAQRQGDGLARGIMNINSNK